MHAELLLTKIASSDLCYSILCTNLYSYPSPLKHPVKLTSSQAGNSAFLAMLSSYDGKFNQPSRLAKILDALVNGVHWLLSNVGSSSGLAKNQLCLQGPGRRYVVLSLEPDVDCRIVVLQVAAKTFSFKGSPEYELVHAAGMMRP